MYSPNLPGILACDDPDADQDDNCSRADIGKNQFYITFAMGTPQTSIEEGGAVAEDTVFSLVNNLVAQQTMYNAPEANWRTGDLYRPMSTANMWDFGEELNFSIFNTEIARRASLMSQSLGKALNSENGLIAMPLFKEGIINQGGPADIMARRVVIPDGLGACEGVQIGEGTPGGPQGVQPVIDEATWTCEEGATTCTFSISGSICVDGQSDPLDVILEVDNYVTDDEICTFDPDFAFDQLVKVGDDYTFEGTCEVAVELEPCSVDAITGPGLTTGEGQASDPVNVDGVTEECVGAPVE